MTSNILEFDAAKIWRETNENQARAASANHSAWVSANAGSGKTYVLVRRVLSLLLSGSSPMAILCLTFTKAAAAEMANRLIAELGRWAVAPEPALYKNVAELLQRPPTANEIDLARRLFAQVIETPGGLRIMTIHAFCNNVLRRFPLEAGVSPNFTVLSDEDADLLRRESAESTLGEAADHPHGQLGQALLRIVAYANENQFDELLQAVLSSRDDLRTLILRHDEEDPFTGISDELRRALGLGPDEIRETFLAAQRTLCPSELLAEAIAALDEGKPTDRQLARKLEAARLATTAAAAIEALADAFLTGERKARSDRFITKAIRDRRPQLAQALEQARDTFAAIEVKLRAATAADATDALLRLADAVIAGYDAAKAARSALDYDDLIAKTVSLLAADGGSGWVLYRLDGGLDHVLVDEAQDTSPSQWRVITGLTDEFFAGEGAREMVRTIFAVGDEKQSIYSFQGAEPRRFAEMGRMFRARAESAGRSHLDLPLLLSFRSAEPVLRAVDLVFRDPAQTPGLSPGQREIRHYAHRNGHAGLVELWPTERAEKAEECDAWEPLHEARARTRPSDRLAARIAGQIRKWLDDGEPLPSRGRAIRPGDILILVKKREPFARPMIRALKDRGIPVAGADRMRLTDELAVQDLMSLGDFVLLPEDDLTLACLLKSPAFDFTDDDLFEIAHDCEGSLWRALRAKADERPLFTYAARRLREWLSQADQIPPYEFYIERLEHEGLHDALLRRLGVEAADSIGEFLDLALAYEQNAVPSLQGFLHWLRQSGVEIKRDMEQGRDETRVMTVHGAKGLEADIVFLADTCSTRSPDRSPLLVFEPEGALSGFAKQFLWTPPGCGKLEVAQAARELAKASEREEYHRLLYVAMTRARDRLYVCGFEGVRGRDAGCWHNLIDAGLRGVASEDSDGTLRLETTQTAPVPPSRDTAPPLPRLTPPAWSDRQAPAEPAPRRPRAATSLGGNDAGRDHLASSGETNREAAIKRGVLIHKLLEFLPTAPRSTWESAGRRFLAGFAPDFSPAEREAIIEATLQILREPRFEQLWGPESRAEVEVVAEAPSPEPGEPPLRLSGQIDRLVVLDDAACIVDYKTTENPPRRLEEVPRSYLLQLAAYRLAVGAIFPEKAIRCALLWTSTPELMEIPDSVLGPLTAAVRGAPS